MWQLAVSLHHRLATHSMSAYFQLQDRCSCLPRVLRVGSACSGTDLLFAALKTLTKFWATIQIDITFEHTFSADTKPNARTFISSNWSPKVASENSTTGSHPLANPRGPIFSIVSVYRFVLGLEVCPASGMFHPHSSVYTCVCPTCALDLSNTCVESGVSARFSANDLIATGRADTPPDSTGFEIVGGSWESQMGRWS